MDLVKDSDPVLRQVAEEIDFSAPPFDIKATAKEMFDLMEKERGLGLACPQVGLPYRMFIMLVDERLYSTCIDPEIVDCSDDIIKSQEGCLTFPNLFVNINRKSWIDVKLYDGDGEQYEQRLDGIHARCFQHELDHLDGKLFVDLASKLSLNMAKKKQKKIMKRNK